MEIWHLRLSRVLIWGTIQSPYQSTQIWCYSLFSGHLSFLLNDCQDLFTLCHIFILATYRLFHPGQVQKLISGISSQVVFICKKRIKIWRMRMETQLLMIIWQAFCLKHSEAILCIKNFVEKCSVIPPILHWKVSYLFWFVVLAFVMVNGYCKIIFSYHQSDALQFHCFFLSCRSHTWGTSAIWCADIVSC